MLWLGCGSLLFLLFTSYTLYENIILIIEWDIMHVSFFLLSISLVFDFFSFLFFFVILLISMCIFFFSQYYMDTEKNFKGFLLLLLSFVISMVFLIFSSNLAFMLLGWDGLGIISYLLVVFYSSYSSSVAGMLTFLINRLGDVFFILSISFLFFLMDWNFMENKFFFFIISVMMICAFITKSAQVPFSSWLPAAMAAPTPVSSLVHSSTLVTAGVYLFIRFSKIFFFNMFVLMVLGILTILIAGIMANLDWDLKKIIAYSTLSQLGFMVSSFSCGLVLFTFFHLLTHALFKASLFMCSGVLIHSADNSQDFRNSGGFMFSMPFLSLAILVCLLCLCGFPFSSGFFSKDFILDGANFSFLLFFLFFTGVLLTFFYSIRFSLRALLLVLMVRSKMVSFYEVLIYLLLPIWILVMFALFMGFYWSEMFFLFSVIFLTSVGWKIFYWSAVLLVCLLSMNIFFSFFSKINKYYLSHMMFLSRIFSSYYLLSVLWVSSILIKLLDQAWSEIGGPSGIMKVSLIGSWLFWRQMSFLFSFFFLSFLFFLL